MGALFLLALGAPFFGRDEVVAKRRVMVMVVEGGRRDVVGVSGWVMVGVRGLLEQRVVMLGSMQNLAVIRIRMSRRGGGMVTFVLLGGSRVQGETGDRRQRTESTEMGVLGILLESQKNSM